MTVEKEIEILRDPTKIQEACSANSPRVLMFAFDRDPHVRAVINAGPRAVPLIARELEKNAKNLNEITVSAYAYILGKIDPAAARKALLPVAPKYADRKGFFIPTFLTYVLRRGRRLPQKKRQFYYTASELAETIRIIKRKEVG